MSAGAAIAQQASLAEVELRPPKNRWDGAAWFLAIAVFAALSFAAAVTSRGFLEADGCTHYLFARHALEEPHYLVNVWGRPLFTMLYALPAAWGGLIGVRTTSLLLAVGCGLVAGAIARGQGDRRPALALIFTLAQPLVFLHSFSELTELPFALLVGLAFLAYQRKQWLAMSILAALGPLARPEGFGFLLLAAAALLAHRRWWWLAVLPAPLVLWNHAGWAISGRPGAWWEWLPKNWPYSAQSTYAAGSPLHFVALLPAITSPFIFPATALGIWQHLRGRFDITDHRDRCRRLIAIIPLLILAGHSTLYAAGKMASSGELRYMLVVAPFWGLLAATGWQWIFDRLRWTRPLRWAGVAALAGGLANAVYPVVPIVPDEGHLRSLKFVEWYRSSGAAERFPRVCAAQPTIYYLLDLSPTDARRALEFHRDTLAEPLPGTIIVWDPVYSLYNSDTRRIVRLEALLDSGWVEAPAASTMLGGGWRILHGPSEVD